MKFHILTLSLFFGISPLLSSDFLTVEQQNEEMDKAFKGENLSRTKKKTIENATEQETINSQSPQILEQIFPGYSDNKLTEKQSITIDQYEQIKKHASETMFHRLNDALNFVLTNREIILSAILKKPELIALTCYTVGQGEQGELYFEFPLLSTSHPVANLAQGYLILKEYQYWIDILLLFKSTVFSLHTLSSYNHNAACAVKDLIQSQISKLEERENARSKNPINLSQVIGQSDNHDISFFVNADHSFHDLLKGCLKSIDHALPRGTMTQVNMNTASSRKNNEHIIDLGKNIRKSALEKLSPKIHDLYACFSKNYHTLLHGIRSIAIMEYVTNNFIQQEIDEATLSPFYVIAQKTSTQLLEGGFDYNQLFNGLKHNLISVQKIRKELGLPKEIFKGMDFSKEMRKALKNYQLARQEMLMEGLQVQGIEVRTEAETKAVEVLANNLIEPQDDQKTNQELTQMGSLTIHAPVLLPAIDKNTDNEEENFIFDGSYFKRIHQYHQNQKTQNTTGNLSKQNLSNYEIKLYSYLMDNIFRPQQRPTWDTLVSNLAAFGFKGKPNTSGNGSTWEFFVTEKNALFYMNPNYQGATFNVHEFKGNEPIHPRYLKFFQSGFSNVFGLTEEYILKH